MLTDEEIKKIAIDAIMDTSFGDIMEFEIISITPFYKDYMKVYWDY